MTSVQLHPLVLLNISDQLTRHLSDDGKFSSNQPVIGALLGLQNGRAIEIITSYPLLLDASKLSLDRKFFESEQELIKQVFPNYEFLGWYSVGQQPVKQDITLHKQILDLYNNNALLLMFDPTLLKATEQRETLPLTVYETVPGHAAALKSPSVVPCEGEKFYLHSVDFTLATSDAELVGVEHAVKTSLSQQQTAAGKLINQQNAVSILMDRVQQVHAYLLDVCENRRTADPIILGEINSLCSKLDFMSNAASDELQAVLNKESEDTTAIYALNQMTQMISGLSDVIDKSNVAFCTAASSTLDLKGSASAVGILSKRDSK